MTPSNPSPSLEGEGRVRVGTATRRFESPLTLPSPRRGEALA
jgi:hypothetical protein